MDPCVRRTLQSKEYEENIPSNGSITSEGLHPVRVRRSPRPPRRPVGLGSGAEQQRGTGCWRGGCKGRTVGGRCTHPELHGRLQGGTEWVEPEWQVRMGLCKDAPEEDKEGNNENRKEAVVEV